MTALEREVNRLRQAMAVDLQACHTDLERQLCRVVCEREIRELIEGTKS
jgi:hypothetical protein